MLVHVLLDVTVVGSETGFVVVLVMLLFEMELTTVVEAGGLAVADSSPGSTTVVHIPAKEENSKRYCKLSRGELPFRFDGIQRRKLGYL